MSYNFDIPDLSQKVEEDYIFGQNVANNSIPNSLIQENYIRLPGDNNSGFGLTPDLASKHMLILGEIGSGKTNCFNYIMQSLVNNLNQNDVLIVFDTKGDFKERFYNPLNFNHYLVGNNTVDKNDTLYWNIFREFTDENGNIDEVTLREIAKDLFKEQKSESQPFFELAATDIFCKVMEWLAKEHLRKGLGFPNTNVMLDFFRKGSINDFYRVLTDPNYEEFRSALSHLGPPNNSNKSQATGVLATITNMVNSIFIGPFGRNKNKPEFNIKELVGKRGGKVIFIEYDLTVGNALAPVYRILFDLALKEALSVRGVGAKGNVFVLVDEFKLLGNLSHISDAVNYGRSKGVKVFAGLQSINQVYSLYGKEDGDALMSGFANCIFFKNNDFQSRDYFINRLGNAYTNIQTTSMGRPDVTHREGHIIEDWDLQTLNIGEAYIALADEEPFRFKFQLFNS